MWRRFSSSVLTVASTATDNDHIMRWPLQLSASGKHCVSLQELAAQFLVSQQSPAPWQTTCQPRGSCVELWSSPPSPPSWGNSCSAASTPICRGPSWWVQPDTPCSSHTGNTLEEFQNKRLNGSSWIFASLMKSLKVTWKYFCYLASLSGPREVN